MPAIYLGITLLLEFVNTFPSVATIFEWRPWGRDSTIASKAVTFGDEERGAVGSEEDVDVLAEAERVKSGASREQHDVVRLDELRKVYPVGNGAQPKVAVRGLSFGIARGECFGFLGINGVLIAEIANLLALKFFPGKRLAERPLLVLF